MWASGRSSACCGSAADARARSRSGAAYRGRAQWCLPGQLDRPRCADQADASPRPSARSRSPASCSASRSADARHSTIATAAGVYVASRTGAADELLEGNSAPPQADATRRRECGQARSSRRDAVTFATAGRSRRYGSRRLPEPQQCTPGQPHLWRYVKAVAGMRCARARCGVLLQGVL